jgi:erythromycin esterase
VEEDPYVPPTPLGVSAEWLRENAKPLSSLDSDDYADLQFLKEVIGESRIVQLGESGHGVAEFNRAKVRLIKFLHQEMGFEVVAFESSLFECFLADRNAESLSSVDLMKECLYPVWHTWEVVPLFDYIKETRTGNRPLILAGFDMQPSNLDRYENRPSFLTDIVKQLDPDLASELKGWEHTLLAAVRTSNMWRLSEVADDLMPQYRELLDWFNAHDDDLLDLFPSDPAIPLMARQLVRTTLNLLEHGKGRGTPGLSCFGEVRDHGMAVNLSYLVRKAYRGKKTIVWAHNYHIRHDNDNVRGWSPRWGVSKYNAGCRNMGEELFERHRGQDGLYTVGLYMRDGVAAWNDRGLYAIASPEPNTLESYLAEPGDPYLFLDLLAVDLSTAPEWVKSGVPARSWGQQYLYMILREQYDGILFIRSVNPPNYVPLGY